MGRSVKAEWWIVDVQKKKELIISQAKGSKIIILSGSNGLFGINSKTISEKVGIQTFNLSLHAGLDISYYQYLIEKHVKKGDIVIMPLEYEYYTKEGSYSDWFINNMNAWGESYLKSLALREKVSFFTHTSLFRVLNGALSSDKKMITPDIYIESHKGNESGFNYGYRYTSLNALGDFNLNDDKIEFSKQISSNLEKYKEELSYNKTKRVITSDSINSLMKINKLIKKKEARLYITWPATISSKFFNGLDSTSVAFTSQIASELHKANINTLCDEFYANMPAKYFLDSRYHLNSHGAKIRSDKLALCINDAIDRFKEQKE